MGTVLAVCVSREKGTQKENIGTAVFLEDWGIQGDAHAGKWHRQVSLLSHEKLRLSRPGRRGSRRSLRRKSGGCRHRLPLPAPGYPLSVQRRSAEADTDRQKSATTAARFIRPWASASCPGRAYSLKYCMAVRFPWATRCAYCRMRRRHKFSGALPGTQTETTWR